MNWSHFLPRFGLTALRVSGSSMAPTYNDGDWLLFRAISLSSAVGGSNRELRALIGQVVLIQRQSNMGSDFLQIKRVLRLVENDGVEDSGIWVEGDNKIHSTDSRTWGALRLDEVRGVFLFRYRRGIAQATGL